MLDRRTIDTPVSYELFAYAIHHAEHCALSGDQRLAVQHYSETVQRMWRAQEKIDQLVQMADRGALGLLRPTTAQQAALFDAVTEFTEKVYSALSALASVHGRIQVAGTRIPGKAIASVERFLDWMESLVPSDPAVFEVLRLARDFRTVIAHPGQFPVYNWHTASGTSDLDFRVVLVGKASSTGRVPPGAQTDDPKSRWMLESPSAKQTSNALERLTAVTFHSMAGQLQDDEVARSRCTWEADRREFEAHLLDGVRWSEVDSPDQSLDSGCSLSGDPDQKRETPSKQADGQA